ncbi:MAG: phage head closure protein [Haemophilus parainfluenzae]|nr:phage head closure protein [Haemophilus parainfluenzae]
MNIGKLRHRITLLQQVNEVNDYGASTQTWKRVATVWADVRPLSGREYFSAQQVQSEVTTQIWLRHIEGIKPTMKVKFGKREFEILSVLNTQERDVSLQLMCKETGNV